MNTSYVLRSLRKIEEDGGFDLDVVDGGVRAQPWDRPNDRVIAELVNEKGPRYTICEGEAGGYVLRVYSHGDYEYSPSLDRVTFFPADESDYSFAPLFLSGAVPSFVLMMRGVLVLHASSVELAGEAIAFAGRSGVGKSTVAAAVCTQGGKLIGDDVAVVRALDGIAVVRLGTEEVRLRPAAAALAAHFDEHVKSATTDERLAIRPTRPAELEYPLRAIVLPFPNRAIDAPVVTLLSPAQSAFEVARYTRIENWQRADDLKRFFDLSAEVVSCTSVLRLDIPWGIERYEEIGRNVAGALEPYLVKGASG